MKAKIYPIHDVANELKIDASIFALHLEILLASIAKGTSTIKNLTSCNEIDTTIAWCKSFGAIIRQVGNKLIIKGVNKDIKYQNSLFVCNKTSTTAKLMLAILCLNKQPFGIQGSPEIIEEIASFCPILEMFGVKCFKDNGILRFENQLVANDVELDGDLDIYFAASLLIALPLVKKNSSIRLIAPIRLEKNYSTVLKIVKKFHVDIKHPSSMKYEISGNQKYSHNSITTEMDKFLLSHYSLLSQKLEGNRNIKLTNYITGSTDEYRKLYNFMKENVVYYSRFPKKILKKRTISVHRVEYNVENSLPLLMVICSLSDQDTTISKVDFTKPRIKKQFEIMSNIFAKLKIGFSSFEDESIIHIEPSSVKEIKQVDCQNDPIIAMAITMLALLSDEAIVIRNAECIYEINYEFFNTLKRFGATIEFIHDN